MNTKEVLRWAMLHHHPQLVLTTGVLRAGRDSWHTFLRKAMRSSTLALLVRIEQWQRLEQEVAS